MTRWLILAALFGSSMRIVAIIIFALIAQLAFAQPSVTGVETADNGAGTSASLVVNRPAGAVDGGALVAILHTNANDITSASLTPPTGFTNEWSFAEGGLASHQGNLGYVKQAGPSEPSTYTFSFSTGRRWSVALLHISDGDFSSIVTGLSTRSNTNTDSYPVTVALTAITTPADNSLVIAFYSANDDASGVTHSEPSTWTEQLDFESTDSVTDIGIASTTQASAGSTGTVQPGLDGTTATEGWTGGLLAIGPSGGSGGSALPAILQQQLGDAYGPHQSQQLGGMLQ